MQAPVLLLQHGVAAFDYDVPDNAPAGTVVIAPLGPRRVAGVVWDRDRIGGVPAAVRRLRPIVAVVDLPPVSPALRRLVSWVSDYYLAPPANVLRMVLPQAAFEPRPRPRPCYRLAEGSAGAPMRPQTRERIERLAAVQGGGPRTIAGWSTATGLSSAAIRALVQSGRLEPADAGAPAVPAWPVLPPGPALGPAQQNAADILRAAVAAGGFQPFLLDGVTGSGKTETYFEAVAAAVGCGRQALVLLPEIALTPAWLERFRTRFGFAPLVWHSGLTMAVRRETFAALVAGHAPVVVGARSALFLPLARLGLIIVDEAHDAAFKQEESVPYHGRDVAVMRARFEGLPVVLASATPALETVEQVTRGTYRALHLPERHGKATLPRVHLVDLTRHPPERGRWLSPPLVEALGRRLERGEQSLLFLNRRGYAPLTLCRACGERLQCPNCSAWLVEHRLAGTLQCHHCGHSIAIPRQCPACGAEDALVACGPGVERLAEEVEARWPDASTAIVTSDTLRTTSDAAALAAAVAEGRVQILIGTQILAKGHDFPMLTLVGVVDADLGLAGGDLRAAERTFQQVAQVAGRAGRGERPGEVFIQTHQRHAPVMQALAAQDRDGFLAAERELRLAAHMPPFGRLCAIIVSAEDATEAADAARLLARAAPATAGIEVWGPAPAPLAMLRGRHRWRLLVHAHRSAPLQDFVRDWLHQVPLPARIRVAVDVDPQSFL
jgi:primosomal protein N' (replication factor Y)